VTSVQDQENVPEVRQPAGRRLAYRGRKVPTWLMLLAFYCLGFAVYGSYRYVTFDQSQARTLPPRPDVPFQYPLLVLHILFGAVAISTAWLQVWPWLRNTYPVAHRWIGRTYFFLGVFPSGLLALPTAVLLTGGQSVRLALFTMGVLWLFTGIAGYRAARQHRYADHRVWMLRSVALTTAVVTMRPLSYGDMYLMAWLLPDTYPLGRYDSFIQMEAVGLWGALAQHLVIVEWFILKPARRQPARNVPPAPRPSMEAAG
jgi:hypothetical protein